MKSQRFGERGSGMGGGTDSSCLSVSLETDCIKQTLNGQTELWPLRRGNGRGGHLLPATGALNALLVTDG